MNLITMLTKNLTMDRQNICTSEAGSLMQRIVRNIDQEDFILFILGTDLAQVIDFELYTSWEEADSQQFGFVETKTQKYIALKIIIADESDEKSSELRLVNREGLDFREVGGECIAVPHEHFWHNGPNGRHLCLVLPVLGPRVSALWGKFEDPTKVSRDVAL